MQRQSKQSAGLSDGNMMLPSQLKLKSLFIPTLIFASLHFGVTLFLYYWTTSTPPDYDFVTMFEGIRLINGSSRYAFYNILAPSLYLYHWKGGLFYAGSLWWTVTLLISLFFGILCAFVQEWIRQYRRGKIEA